MLTMKLFIKEAGCFLRASFFMSGIASTLSSECFLAAKGIVNLTAAASLPTGHKIIAVNEGLLH